MDLDDTRQVEAAVSAHLRASHEPVREMFLYERVRADVVDVSPDDFVAVLLRMEVQGRVYMDPAHDDAPRDPEPFQPRFWRIIE